MLLSAQQIERLMGQLFTPELWIGLADYSEAGFAALLAGLWLTFLLRRTRDTWVLPAQITVAMGIGVPLNELLRFFIGQTRPFHDGGFEPLIVHEADFGMPSNHAMATALFTIIFLMAGQRTWGVVLGLLTVLIGFARVVTGLHYPMDILSGWILGGAIAALISYYRIPRYHWLPSSLKKSDQQTSSPT